MPVTDICNASTTTLCCQITQTTCSNVWYVWRGLGQRPRLAASWQQSLGAAAPWMPARQRQTLRSTTKLLSICPSGPRWRGPVSLLIRGPAGAPCAPAVPWAHPWAGARHHGAPRRAHVAAVARCQKVPRLAGRAQRGPLATPLNACWRLAALPARATCGGGLSACARGCRWHSLRNNARASRADGAAAMPPLHYRAAGALSRPRAHKPLRAARPLPLAACRWPHPGGARPPGPVTGLGRLARP